MLWKQFYLTNIYTFFVLCMCIPNITQLIRSQSMHQHRFAFSLCTMYAATLMFSPACYQTWQLNKLLENSESHTTPYIHEITIYCTYMWMSEWMKERNEWETHIITCRRVKSKQASKRMSKKMKSNCSILLPMARVLYTYPPPCLPHPIFHPYTFSMPFSLLFFDLSIIFYGLLNAIGILWSENFCVFEKKSESESLPRGKNGQLQTSINGFDSRTTQKGWQPGWIMKKKRKNGKKGRNVRKKKYHHVYLFMTLKVDLWLK